MNRRQRITISAVHLVGVVVCGCGWFWSFMWQASSVAEMSDQLQIDGALDERRVRQLLRKDQTLPEYLMQGHDVSTLRWGAGLAALAVAGSFTGLLRSVRRAGGGGGGDR